MILCTNEASTMTTWIQEREVWEGKQIRFKPEKNNGYGEVEMEW